MTDTGWPDEAREAVARAILARDPDAPEWADADESWRAIVMNEADAALAALAPFLAARIADAEQAGAEAMRDQIAKWNDAVQAYCEACRDAAQTSRDETVFEVMARDRKSVSEAVRLMPLPVPGTALASRIAAAEARGRIVGRAEMLKSLSEEGCTPDTCSAAAILARVEAAL